MSARRIILGEVIPDPPQEPKTYYFCVYKPKRKGSNEWQSLALFPTIEEAERDAEASLVGFPRKLCVIKIS